MPVLLLCQGDPDGKELLRRAIETRYGINPPAIENLQIDFKGRARIKLGPIETWIPVEAEASFVLPTHLRWDFVVKPFNFPVQRGIEAFDGVVFRTGRGSKLNGETEIIASARGRLWGIAALLLTPMSDHYIKISKCGDNCIEALNTKLHDTVKIYLRDDYSVERCEVDCLNPDTNKVQKHVFKLDHDQTIVDGLMLPTKVSAYWDDTIAYEMEPTRVDTHPELPDTFFTLESVTNKA